MNIGQAAAAAGVSAKMVRHYEGIGLLPEAGRSLSNYRVYGETDVHLLRFIKRSRTLGFSMAEIKDLVGLWRNRSRSSAAVKKIAGRHRDELKRKVAELEAMIGTLDHLVKHCHGDHRPDCPILEDLAQQGRRNPAV
jgi:Cu(I)-responsive transcriptional regulator